MVAIVAGQEFQWVLSAHGRQKRPGAVPSFEYFKEDRRVGIYYFYILDPEFGPGFTGSVATHRGPERCASTDTSGSNGKPRVRGWRSPRSPTALRALPLLPGCKALCDRFGPADVQAFFDRWITRIPTPLTAAGRAAGY